MSDQIVEVEKRAPVSITDIKRSLGIPETNNPVDFHDRIIASIVTTDENSYRRSSFLLAKLLA